MSSWTSHYCSHVPPPGPLEICRKPPPLPTLVHSLIQFPFHRCASAASGLLVLLAPPAANHTSVSPANPRSPLRRNGSCSSVSQRGSGPGYSRRDSRPRVHGGGERPGRRRRRGRQARRRWRRGPGWRFIPSYSLMAPRRRQEGDPLPDYGEFLPSTYC